MQMPDLMVREPEPEAGVKEADQQDPPPVPLSRWPRLLLAAISLLIVGATAAQLVSMFLVAAPRNTISQRYRAQISWWVEPWLEQDWRLFAPDPQTANIMILARARRSDGTVSGWVDLTAADYAAIAHDPMPSQANENELRRAWDAYLTTLPASASASGSIDDTRANLLRQYLANVVAQRLAGSTTGTFTSVQLKAVSTPITPPGTTPAKASREVSTPWFAL